VKHQPRSFIASKTKLTLEKEGREATLVGRHQVRRPKPNRKRRLCVVKNRSRCQRYLMTAGGALPALLFDYGISTGIPAPRALVALGPPAYRQVFLACPLGCELQLEFAQSNRERHADHALYYIWWSAETTG
jgi:hypothetical protein